MEETKVKYSAQRKYLSESRDKLTLNIQKGLKEKWKELASNKGMTLTQYITKLIEDDNRED